MKYQIHDNGGRPFLVETNNTTGSVYVYKRIDGDDEIKFSVDPILSFDAKHIFIGKSPLNKMTKFSGGHGKRFDGNTILIQIDDKEYVYIGEQIYKFKSYGKIVKYESPVGNNDVPYPYAIDEIGKTYLMIEDVVLYNYKKNSVYDNPYDYYYHYNLITEDIGSVPREKSVLLNNLDIVEFYIGDKKYTLRYKTNPAKEYKRLIPEYGDKMYIVTIGNSKKKILTKDDYIKLMKGFGKTAGFTPMKGKKMLVKRKW